MILAGLKHPDPVPAIGAALSMAEFYRLTGLDNSNLLIEAREIARHVESESLEANCTKSLGDIAIGRSDYNAAIKLYRETLPLFERIDDLLGQANCIQRLGEIDLLRFDYDSGELQYRKALSLFKNLGDLRGQANCIQRLGDIKLRRFELVASTEFYREAYSFFERVGDLLGQANCIQRLGDIALHISDNDTAQRQYQGALPIFQRVGDLLGQANCIEGLGDIALHREETELARDRYQEALPLFQRIGSLLGQANCIQRLGDIELKQSDLDAARERYREALALYERVQDLYSIGRVQSSLARVAPSLQEYRNHVEMARMAWIRIKRPDLVEWLEKELPPHFGETTYAVATYLDGTSTEQKHPHHVNVPSDISSRDTSIRTRGEMELNALVARESEIFSWTNWLNGNLPEEYFDQIFRASPAQPILRAKSLRLRAIKAFADTGIIDLESRNLSTETSATILFLGDNAAGKSTLLRCLALSFLGPELANQVEGRPDSYLRNGEERGLIEVAFTLDLSHDRTNMTSAVFCVGIEIHRGESSFVAMNNDDLSIGRSNAAHRINWLRRRTNDTFGFLCAYGAHRSLSESTSSIVQEEHKETVDRVASLFRPYTALLDPEILYKLFLGDFSNFRTPPPRSITKDHRTILERHFRELLPCSGAIDTDKSTLMMVHGTSVPIRDLSDGYNSLIALIGHLVRHSLWSDNWDDDPASIRGIVLIDEIDLHLHPSWQRHILPDLRRAFPNLQIIATSHSPVVAGSAADELIRVLKRSEDDVHVLTDNQSIKGWRADQILTSGLFGLSSSRSIQAEELFRKYAELLNERGPEDSLVRQLGKEVSKLLETEGEGIVDTTTYKLLDELLLLKFSALGEETRKQVLANAGLLIATGDQNDQDNA